MVISRAQRTRALHILQGFFLAAESVGLSVQPHNQRHPGSLSGVAIVSDVARYEITITERVHREPAPPPSTTSQGVHHVTWPQQRDKLHPTGRLALCLPDTGGRRTFADGRVASLEDKLGLALAEIQRRDDAVRNHVREQQRLDEAYRHAREHAVQIAADRYRYDGLAKAAQQVAENWCQAETLRAYADSLMTRPLGPDGQDWIAWIRGRADTLDPYSDPVTMPTIRDPLPPDLVPYLAKWPPTRPWGWAESE